FAPVTSRPPYVMAGLVPAIHDFATRVPEDVDARHEAGHDGNVCLNGRILAYAAPRRWENSVSALVMNSRRQARPFSFSLRARRIAGPTCVGSSTRSLQPPRSLPIAA